MQQLSGVICSAGGAGIGHVLDVLAEIPIAVPGWIGSRQSPRDLAPIRFRDGAGRCRGGWQGEHPFGQVGAVYKGDVVKVGGFALQGKFRDRCRIVPALAGRAIRMWLCVAISCGGTGPIGFAAGARENPSAPPYRRGNRGAVPVD